MGWQARRRQWHACEDVVHTTTSIEAINRLTFKLASWWILPQDHVRTAESTTSMCKVKSRSSRACQPNLPHPQNLVSRNKCQSL